ncbi:MAG: alpha/beta hydrolase [Chitinophagaceae bacterium]|nr:alpha/beta hydrolase [Chitinophagaceae bacterium]
MRLFLLFAVVLCANYLYAQQTIPLYEKEAPGMLPVPSAERYDSIKQHAFNVTNPSLTIYLPAKEKATGAAVIVCPGGGYGMLVMGTEGHAIAQYFAGHGVAAFALKYRLPDEKQMKDKSIAPLQDAQRAIQLVRQRAGEWNIDTARIGIMGFSAGGHLASTAGTHFNYPVIGNPQHTSLRPNFMILVYPVVSMTDKLGHGGSRQNLLGKNPSVEKIKLFSNELQVTAQTSPAFLIHAGDDKVVDVDNSIMLYEALRHHKVPAEMHIYPKGDHGFILSWPHDEWLGLCLKWMKSGGYLQ